MKLWECQGDVRVMSGYAWGFQSVDHQADQLQAEEPLQASRVCALARVLTWLRVELTSQAARYRERYHVDSRI